jgi:hypothetical protein
MNDRNKKIDIAIDKTHLKSDKEIIPHVKKSIPTATTKEIKAENATRPKDNHPHDEKRYYIPIFSSHSGAYQIDLLEQSHERDKAKYPNFFFIAINVNTRYAYAFAQNDKTADSILESIKKLCEENKKPRVVSLVSDEEAGVVSQKVIDFLNDKKISLKTITEQRHSPLGMIDGFIRRLRDMNTPTVHGKSTSENPKYRDFSTDKMDKLINIHNNTVNSATKHTPLEMKNDEKLERSYIISKLYERERRMKITDAELPEGTKVRFILERNPLAKKRYKVSPEYYQIAGKDSKSFIIMAKDGTTKTISRWRLFPVRDSTKLKFGASFGNNRGELDRIDSWNARTKKFVVRFKMPDGSYVKDSISKLDLRGSNPQLETELEKEFRERNGN